MSLIDKLTSVVERIATEVKGKADATETMVTVAHGSVAATARPTAGSVYWVGSVEPTNAVQGDLFFDTSEA